MMSNFRLKRRQLLTSVAGIILGARSLNYAYAEVPPEDPLSARLAPVVVYLRIKKTDAKNGAVYNVDCTGFLIGKDGWVLTTAHPVSAPILDSKNAVILTQPIPEILGSIGQRRQELETLRVHVVNDKLDLALLQFQNFSDPRDKLSFGRSSNINVGDSVFASGFMYEDKPRTTIELKIASKGGVSPLWNLREQTTKGLSGAPLVNRNGHVVAVLIGGDERSAGGSYALPINLAREYAVIAEATYADDLTLVTPNTSPDSFQKTFPHKFSAPSVIEETIIRRQYVKTYVVPSDCEIVSAAFSVDKQEGLSQGPIVTITERNVSVTYSLDCGPKSSGKNGWLEGSLVMDLVKK